MTFSEIVKRKKNLKNFFFYYLECS